MGNWRTVNIAGTIGESHVGPLRDRLGYTFEAGDSGWDHYGPLSFNRQRPLPCGLNNWVAAQANAIGNLAERDFDPEDVAQHLRELLGVAPSMLLAVHCGGDYESLDCVATVLAGEGLVVVGAPQVGRVEEIPDEQVTRNLLANLIR
jgi:hypothetical protein